MTHADGVYFWLDVLHGVVDCEAGGYETAGGVYVHVDGLFGGLGERTIERTIDVRVSKIDIYLFLFCYVCYVCSVPHLSLQKKKLRRNNATKLLRNWPIKHDDPLPQKPTVNIVSAFTPRRGFDYHRD